MSNYRRLISYIYAYEGGIKGKNVGFAKLEVRNGQCKILAAYLLLTRFPLHDNFLFKDPITGRYGYEKRKRR